MIKTLKSLGISKLIIGLSILLSCKTPQIRRSILTNEAGTQSILDKQMITSLPNNAEVSTISIGTYGLAYLTASSKVEPEIYQYSFCLVGSASCIEGSMFWTSQVIAPLSPGNYNVYVSSCAFSEENCGPKTQLQYTQIPAAEADLEDILTSIKTTNQGIRSMGSDFYNLLSAYRKSTPASEDTAEQNIDMQLVAGPKALGEMINSSTFSETLLKINGLKSELASDSNATDQSISIAKIDQALSQTDHLSSELNENSSLLLALGSAAFVSGVVFSVIGYSVYNSARDAESGLKDLGKMIDKYADGIKRGLADGTSTKTMKEMQAEWVKLNDRWGKAIEGSYSEALRQFNDKIFRGLNAALGMSTPLSAVELYGPLPENSGQFKGKNGEKVGLVILESNGRVLEEYAKNDPAKVERSYLVHNDLVFKAEKLDADFKNLVEGVGDKPKLVVKKANKKVWVYKISKAEEFWRVEEYAPKVSEGQILSDISDYVQDAKVVNASLIDVNKDRVFHLGANQANFERYEWGLFSESTQKKFSAELSKIGYSGVITSIQAVIKDVPLIDTNGNLLEPHECCKKAGVNWFSDSGIPSKGAILTIDGVEYKFGDVNVKRFPIPPEASFWERTKGAANAPLETMKGVVGAVVSPLQTAKKVGSAGLWVVGDKTLNLSGRPFEQYVFLQAQSQNFIRMLEANRNLASYPIAQLKSAVDGMPEIVTAKSKGAFEKLNTLRKEVEVKGVETLKGTKQTSYSLAYSLMGMGFVSAVVGAVAIGFSASNVTSLAAAPKQTLIQGLNKLSHDLMMLHKSRLDLLGKFKARLGIDPTYVIQEDEWIFLL